MPRPDARDDVVVEQSATGKVDILVNRRAFAYDEPDLESALYRLKRRYGRGFSYTLVDATGYRTRHKL
jgi:hypothetical protein